MVCEACKGKIPEMAEHHRVGRAQVDSVYYCLSHTREALKAYRHGGTLTRVTPRPPMRQRGTR